MSATPSIVQQAFLPETEYVLTLDGALILEALGCRYLTGGQPGLRDIILSILVMTDEDAVILAHRKGQVDKLIQSVTAAHSLGEVLRLGDKVGEALQAALNPTESGVENDEKKSYAAPDGGLP
jgi:hypothetical protein